MTASPDPLVVRPSSEEVADTVALRLLDHLAGLTALREDPHVVLTGGSLTRRLHARLADLAAEREDVDWARVSLWWGDERYVPTDDDERNAGQALQDGLRRLPLDRERVHVMAASDEGHASAEDAAAAYAEELRVARGHVPEGHAWFHVLLLGIGPDGHCASLFPGRPEVHDPALALAVHDSPKPPPDRISLGLGTLQRADQVWFVAAGEEKADAVARSFAGGDVSQTPSAGPRGLRRTLWFLDEAAAGGIDRSS